MICTISFQSFHITALSSEVLSCRLLGLPAAWWIQRLLHLQRLGHSHPGHARHNLAMAKGKVRGHDIQFYRILSNCTTIHTSTPACTTSYAIYTYIYIYCHIKVILQSISKREYQIIVLQPCTWVEVLSNYHLWDIQSTNPEAVSDM